MDAGGFHAIGEAVEALFRFCCWLISILVILFLLAFPFAAWKIYELLTGTQ